MAALKELGLLFLSQTLCLTHKHWVHKVTGYARRKFLSDIVVIPSFLVAFIGGLTALIVVAMAGSRPAHYGRTPLVKLSSLVDSTRGNVTYFYYTPNNHKGINEMMANFSASPEMAGLVVIGAPDSESMLKQYTRNLFNTFGALEFQLTPQQRVSGKLVTNTNSPASLSGSVIDYAIRLNTQYSFNAVPIVYDNRVLNDVQGHAEAWNSSGYLTLHSWVISYVVNQYGGIGQGRKTELVISPYVQRYPRSNVYEDSVPIDFSYGRYSIWRFAGPIFVSIAMLYPVRGKVVQVALQPYALATNR